MELAVTFTKSLQDIVDTEKQITKCITVNEADAFPVVGFFYRQT